ncbi:hypothetical protein ILYODFUR_033241 [Ilyodon furcidens]|uniref:Uncharacterized protein n=1 Tax=Ilyodon furcidens TaxID=33524 RepID=A0ABV0UAI4_9TELE
MFGEKCSDTLPVDLFRLRHQKSVGRGRWNIHTRPGCAGAFFLLKGSFTFHCCYMQCMLSIRDCCEDDTMQAIVHCCYCGGPILP